MPGPTPTPGPQFEQPIPGMPDPFRQPTPTPTPGYPSGPAMMQPEPMPRRDPLAALRAIMMRMQLMPQGTPTPEASGWPAPRPVQPVPNAQPEFVPWYRPPPVAPPPRPEMGDFPWMMPGGAGPGDFFNPTPVAHMPIHAGYDPQSGMRIEPFARDPQGPGAEGMHRSSPDPRYDVQSMLGGWRGWSNWIPQQ